MTKKYKIVTEFAKDVSYETPEVETYLRTKENISKYNLHLDIDSKPLKNQIIEDNFLNLENAQLRKLIDEQIASHSNLVSARVIIDKQSPYLNSFIINSGSNKKIKNGMTVLDG